MFGSFGLVPQLVHLLERRRLGGLAPIGERSFDRREAPLEFVIGGAQHGFRIGIEVATKIDHRKQMADELGIGMNALRIRAHRIRTGLEECLKECLQ